MMENVGSVITSQSDLLWSLALALVAFEIVIVRNWTNGTWRIRRPFAFVALVVSLTALTVSMIMGYLTYGAVVELVLAAESDQDTAAQFQAAGKFAWRQFLCFAVGFAALIILFLINPKAVADAMQD